MKDLKQQGFTLLEVLLAAVIFAISVVGLYATLNSVRGPVADKENQLTAVLFAKQTMETLYSQVNNATYYTTCPTNAAGNCNDFSVLMSAAGNGIHEVPTATLLAAGLSWPTAAISNCNTCPSYGAACLNYTVSCADNSPGPSCGGNTSIARKIDLKVHWPLFTGGCSA